MSGVRRLIACCSAASVLCVLGGCASSGVRGANPDFSAVRRRAVDCLRAGIRYPHNAAVRVGAIEALERCPEEEVLPWIRLGLLDEHPAVRFAACCALGTRRDETSRAALENHRDDEDGSVQVAALFALHRLGQTNRTGVIPGLLLDHQDPSVRRNAALVLGRLNEPGAIKVLARAMKDADEGVRQHALEAMACLGNEEAGQELTFLANTGIGSEEVFALQALAKTKDRHYVDTFRYKLATASHLETKLAAARALGLMGHDDGFALAMSTLRRTPPPTSDPKDPPDAQRLRIRQLAAGALGGIGRPAALGLLADVLERDGDPRVQVSVAGAIVEIVEASRPAGVTESSGEPGGRK